jgi:polar amino acid transport system permease protein
MILLLPTYCVLVGALVWLMHRWERAMHIPGYNR